MPRAKKQIFPFTVTLNTAGFEYKASADNLFDAISQLDPKVMKIKGIITATDGTRSSQLSLKPVQMRRLAANKMTREVIAKNLSTLLH